MSALHPPPARGPRVTFPICGRQLGASPVQCCPRASPDFLLIARPGRLSSRTSSEDSWRRAASARRGRVLCSVPAPSAPPLPRAHTSAPHTSPGCPPALRGFQEEGVTLMHVNPPARWMPRAVTLEKSRPAPAGRKAASGGGFIVWFCSSGRGSECSVAAARFAGRPRSLRGIPCRAVFETLWPAELCGGDSQPGVLRLGWCRPRLRGFCELSRPQPLVNQVGGGGENLNSGST